MLERDFWLIRGLKYIRSTLNNLNSTDMGIISKSTMRTYKPNFIRLSGSTPLSQCLCDYCENCELMMRALVAAGLRGVPSTKYLAIEETLCDTVSIGQFGTNYSFRKHECISRDCNECGPAKFKKIIYSLNEDLLKLNSTISWHRWQKLEGFSAPQKILE